MPLRRIGIALLATALLTAGLGVSATAATPLSLAVEVSVDADGTPRLGVTRDGRQVLSPAPVGLRTTDADLTRGLHEVGRHEETVTETYTMTTGKRRDRATTMTELVVELATADGARLDLVVRTAPDGIAYRYVLPDGGTVTGEASTFALPTDAPAWLLPYNAWYEQNRERTTAAGAATGDFGYPALFEVGPDFVLLTESDVDGRYAGSRLAHTQGSTEYRVALADEQVPSAGELRTPWRTAIIGDLATVTESTLVDDLAPPARFDDTSWIRPGKVAWSWLSEHSSPSDFARQKDFVDFAAANGWPYVLVDEGWSAAWVPELVRYARAKGVDVLLWFRWTDLDTAQERDTVLPQVARWGVRGVKLDFMESDSRERYQWYDAVLAKTAELRLMVNFHGSTIPHGLARTWPQVLSMEAVRGAENFPEPVNNPVQAFTRNVVGSMDYTPVSLDVGLQHASVAHEVALSVAYESGWQHFADKPEAYERYPAALRFLDQVPTVWDETQLAAGHPDREAVFARRASERWFVGAIATGEARTLTAPLDFLGAGDWLVETVRDDPAVPRGDLLRDTEVRTAADTLSVPVPAEGGFAAVACPNAPGRETCDEPIRQVPASTVTVTPDGEVDVAPGSSFEVTGTFRLDEGAAHDVTLTAAAPPGWSVTGGPVTAPSLDAGETITGTWTVHVAADSAAGYQDVPVYAEFSPPDDPDPVHVERAVRAFVPPPLPTGTPYVSDLPFVAETNGWGPVERDRSNNDSVGGDGNPLTVGGTVYAKGIGTHAPAEVAVYLGGNCTEFRAAVGLDDEVTEPGSVVFQVLGDGAVLFDSGVVTPGPARPSTVDTTGVRLLTLRVTDGGDGKNFDHADWADAALTCA